MMNCFIMAALTLRCTGHSLSDGSRHPGDAGILLQDAGMVVLNDKSKKRGCEVYEMLGVYDAWKM